MVSFYELKAALPKNKTFDFSQLKGKVVLIVNTASKCGFTPQFEGLEKLYKQYESRGFTVLGFPCNQFASQDPGEDDSIGKFCQLVRTAYLHRTMASRSPLWPSPMSTAPTRTRYSSFSSKPSPDSLAPLPLVRTLCLQQNGTLPSSWSTARAKSSSATRLPRRPITLHRPSRSCSNM